MNKLSRDLMQGMEEATAFVEGRKGSARMHVVEVPDVRTIRQQLHMSQQPFAGDLPRSAADTEELGATGRFKIRVHALCGMNT